MADQEGIRDSDGESPDLDWAQREPCRSKVDTCKSFEGQSHSGACKRRRAGSGPSQRRGMLSRLAFPPGLDSCINLGTSDINPKGQTDVKILPDRERKMIALDDFPTGVGKIVGGEMEIGPFFLQVAKKWMDVL